ncbi:hypothetical protein DAPPUDRAFT_30205, partial [Daphnia pulex]
DLNIRNLSEETPLHLACALNNTAVVSELCARRADITAQDSRKRTPLMTAIMSGSQRSALVLLEWEFLDKAGNSMLHVACTGKSANILRHMFENFLDLNIRNLSEETPLHLACALNNTAVVSELCARRADITAQDSRKRTPLMTAIMSGSQRSALVLLE